MFERGGKKAPDVGEEQMKELHAKIGELAVTNEEAFFSPALNKATIRTA